MKLRMKFKHVISQGSLMTMSLAPSFSGSIHPPIAEGVAVSKPNMEVPIPDEVATLLQREQRIAQIDVFSFIGKVSEPAPDDWLSTIGMFDDSPVIEEIMEAGRNIRNAQKLINANS